MKRTLVGTLLVAGNILAASHAQATPLTAANFPLLCRPDAAGRLTVDSDRLALALVDSAGATLLLDGANDRGVADQSIQTVSTPSQPSEPTYLVVQAAASAGDARLFAPPGAAALRNALISELNSIDVNALLRDGLPAGDRRRFRAMIRPGRQSGQQPGGIDPAKLFGPDAVYTIVCEEEPPRPDPARTDAAEGDRPREDVDPERGIRVAPVLRGSVQALWIEQEGSEFAASDAANISYDRDDVADTDTFRINGIVGLQILSRSGTFGAVPYISYQRSSVTGPNDIEKLSPGLLLTHAYEGRSLALHSRLEISYIDDMEQGSRQGKLRLYIDPTFRLGRLGPLFGSSLRLIDGLFFRPELTLIADASRIFRAGTSTALANADSYFGAGGDLSLSVGPASGALDFVRLTVGARDLAMFGGIDQDHIRRWYGSLTFTPPDFPYFGLSLTFTDGENDDTFQVEERVSLGLTFRY